jgi:hypothetical protein
MTLRHNNFFVYLAFGFLMLPVSSFAWYGQTHNTLAYTTASSLKNKMPDFFVKGAATIAHCAVDPDAVKNRQLPAAKKAEGPEHFIDWELLKGNPLPKNRMDYLKMCCKNDIDPEKSGFVPYAAAEWTERLAMSLAEYRAWPDNPAIMAKCLVYAGILAHYSADICQPLHLTINYDGRVTADGASPHSGIHDKTDALIELHGFMPDSLSATISEAQPLDTLFKGIVAEIEKNRQLIDTVYALESILGHSKTKQAAHPGAFALRQGREAVRFTASLYLSAWRLSEQIVLESWMNRNEMDSRFIKKNQPSPSPLRNTH